MTSALWTVAAIAAGVGAALGLVIERIAPWALARGDAGIPFAWRRRPAITCAATAIACGGITVVVGLVPTLPAWWSFAVFGIAVIRIDLATHRIPDVIALPMVVAGLALFGAASLTTGDFEAMSRAGFAMAAVFGVFLLLGLIGPVGMGDVKLAPALGLYLGYLSWASVVFGLFAGFALGACAGLVVVISARIRGGSIRAAFSRAIPFGPFLVAGTVVALIAA